MTFSVYCSVFAHQEVTHLEQAADPARIREAVGRIEWALRRTSRDMGESRDPGFRLWYEDVLGVFYEIDEDTLRVDILYVGLARRH